MRFSRRNSASAHHSDLDEAIAFLRSPAAIRERSNNILEAGLAGKLAHFDVSLDRLEPVAAMVAETTLRNYPRLDVPFHCRWNHFRIGEVDLTERLLPTLFGPDPLEVARTRCDLVVVSVLLDAGAGAEWSFRDPETDERLSRSEGLAAASLHMFVNGAFSERYDLPCRVTAEGLSNVTERRLRNGFQVGTRNPLVGITGRLRLLHGLGDAMDGRPDFFGSPARPGHLIDRLHTEAQDKDGLIDASLLLRYVLEAFASIWPRRLKLGSENLGDVWRHPHAGGTGPTAELVPFHKLSQWLSYSLVDPLDRAGLGVTHVERLTGLAEYRNGGLFVDGGVLTPKHAGVFANRHLPGDELIVEWRALTIALLDRLAPLVREHLGVDSASMPLAKILEGGTWATGRQLAHRLRGGAPPIQVDSDGTVF